jgi:hypothetical protein
MRIDSSPADTPPSDAFAFVVDVGSESEYHLKVRLPLRVAAAARLEGVLHELERVYRVEGLPEWRRHSFLAVAAALAEGNDGVWGDDGDGGGDGPAAGERRCNALDELRALQPGELQLFVDDFAEQLDAMRLSERGPQEPHRHLPSLSQSPSADAVDSEEAVLGLYSLLMRDARKGTVIMELMEGFWREGHALAERRKAELQEAERTRDQEQQSILLRGAFTNEDTIQRRVQECNLKFKARVKSATSNFRKALSAMQKAQRAHLRSLLMVLSQDHQDDPPSPLLDTDMEGTFAGQDGRELGWGRSMMKAAAPVGDGGAVGNGYGGRRGGGGTGGGAWDEYVDVDPVLLWLEIFRAQALGQQAMGHAREEEADTSTAGGGGGGGWGVSVSSLVPSISWPRRPGGGAESGEAGGAGEGGGWREGGEEARERWDGGVEYVAFAGAAQLKRKVSIIVRPGQTRDYCEGTWRDASAQPARAPRMLQA